MSNIMPDQPLNTNLPIKAGFPNPAEDAAGMALDLNQILVKHPMSTYYMRVEGDLNVDEGVNHGDIVVVDRSLDPKNGDLVVAVEEGQFVVKRIKKQDLYLGDKDFYLWGVVTWIVRHANSKSS